MCQFDIGKDFFSGPALGVVVISGVAILLELHERVGYVFKMLYVGVIGVGKGLAWRGRPFSRLAREDACSSRCRGKRIRSRPSRIFHFFLLRSATEIEIGVNTFLICLDLIHELQGDALGHVAELAGPAGLIRENDLEEDGGVTDPVEAEIVVDVNDIAGEGTGGAVDAGVQFDRIGEGRRDVRHKAIISRLDGGRSAG